jgi:hypothetical protein
MNASNDHDEIDRQLRAAGYDMRGLAPNSEQTTRAYQDRRLTPIAPSNGPSRSWWPATISAGLAAAAIIGIVAYNVGQDDAVREIEVSTSQPDETMPTPVTEPSLTRETDGSIDPVVDTVPVADDAVAGILLDVGSGCWALEIRAERTAEVLIATGFCVDVDELIVGRSLLIRGESEWFEVRVEGGPEPLVVFTVRDSDATCNVDGSTYSAGDVIEIVGCNTNREGSQTPIIAELARDAGDAPRWHVPMSEQHSGVELTTPEPVDGLPGMTWAQGPIEGATCTIVMTTGAIGPWFEQCAFADEARSSAIALVEGQIIQFDVANDGGVIATALSDRMALTSGCTVTDAVRLLTGLANDVVSNPVVTAMRCGAPANLVVASQMLQPGAPDGLLAVWEAQPGEDPIQFSDTGTGIETSPVAPFPSVATWSAWATGTEPGVAENPDLAPPLPTTISAWAEQVDGDPFVTLLAVEPDGLPVVVFVVNGLQQGDEEAGSVMAVWLIEAPDGLAPDVAYSSVLCPSRVTDDGGSCR